MIPLSRLRLLALFCFGGVALFTAPSFLGAQTPVRATSAAASPSPATPAPAAALTARFEPILPSATEPEIKEFNEPHWVYLQREIVIDRNAQWPADRHQLLLWIPGTRPPNMREPAPGEYTRYASHTFCMFAASLGYHVISLTYPNTLSAASCNNESDPAAFENFRMSIIAGGTSPRITVSRTDSIENRLIKLLQFLARRSPAEGWNDYLNPDGSIKWESIAVAGQSQGGGHSALIGIHHRVARVLCFGAPKDYSIALNAPAAWYTNPGATPKELYFAFNHDQDRQGCTPEHQIDNVRALRLDQFGAPVSVDNTPTPFQGSHILMTDYPGGKVSSQAAHGTVISPRNFALFNAVWRYMLTR
jgi:hypothetical protein